MNKENLLLLASALALASCGQAQEEPTPVETQTTVTPTGPEAPSCANASINALPMAEGAYRYSSGNDSFQILANGSVRMGMSEGGALSDLYNQFRRAGATRDNFEALVTDFGTRCPGQEAAARVYFKLN